MKLIDHCQYSVADISLGDRGDADKPRLNMAMELGAFFNSMLHGPRRAHRKSLFVMDSEKFLYQETISNLNGVDIHPHGDDPTEVVRGIQKWFTALRIPDSDVPTASRIIARFGLFLECVRKLKKV